MSILGNFNFFFFAAHLLDIAVAIPALKTILQSVTHNGKQVGNEILEWPGNVPLNLIDICRLYTVNAHGNAPHHHCLYLHSLCIQLFPKILRSRRGWASRSKVSWHVDCMHFFYPFSTIETDGICDLKVLIIFTSSASSFTYTKESELVGGLGMRLNPQMEMNTKYIESYSTSHSSFSSLLSFLLLFKVELYL